MIQRDENVTLSSRIQSIHCCSIFKSLRSTLPHLFQREIGVSQASPISCTIYEDAEPIFCGLLSLVAFFSYQYNNAQLFDFICIIINLNITLICPNKTYATFIPTVSNVIKPISYQYLLECKLEQLSSNILKPTITYV